MTKLVMLSTTSNVRKSDMKYQCPFALLYILLKVCVERGVLQSTNHDSCSQYTQKQNRCIADAVSILQQELKARS